MFTFATSDKEAYLRCIDLTSGVSVGEIKLGPIHPNQKLLSGQTYGKDQVLLSYVCEGREDDNVYVSYHFTQKDCILN
jgi:hypothetical protein